MHIINFMNNAKLPKKILNARFIKACFVKNVKLIPMLPLIYQ